MEPTNEVWGQPRVLQDPRYQMFSGVFKTWTRINVSYVLAFLVARLAAFYIFNCVLGQFPFLTVLVLCQLTCSGGLLDSFSLVASWYGVYL